MKIRVIIKRHYGNVEVEGDTLDEIVEGLATFPEWLAVIDRLIETPDENLEATNLLDSIIEVTTEGPQLIVPKDKISSKEAISLILYAQDKESLEPKVVGRLLTLSGHGSTGYGSRLSEMRREGTIIREGNGYRLSSLGRKSVEKLATRLKEVLR